MLENEDVFSVIYPRSSFDFKMKTFGRLDSIANQVQNEGLDHYEFPVFSCLIYLIQHSAGLVLDVGANTGLLSLVAAAANPLVRVVAFEPLKAVRELLNANIMLNAALAPRIAIEPFGLSDKAGTFTFYETINNIGLVTTSSSLELSHASSVGEYKEQFIETLTLDTWMEGMGPSALQVVKIDVEGHEYAVLQGGKKTFAKHRPFITIEVLGKAEREPLDRFINEVEYTDFVIAPTEFRHCVSVRHHPDAWVHLLCPTEKTSAIFQAARYLGLQVAIR